MYPLWSVSHLYAKKFCLPPFHIFTFIFTGILKDLLWNNIWKGRYQGLDRFGVDYTHPCGYHHIEMATANTDNEPVPGTSVDTDSLSKPIKENGSYDNPWDSWQKPMFSNLFKFMFREKDHSNIPKKEVLDETLPIIKPDCSVFDSPVSSGVLTMWIGHATVLVKFDNVTILTDPIFSERCSIVQFAGPKRYRKPPCEVNDLPKIDAVVISHNHYDHLDKYTVHQLNTRFGKNLRWYVPQGMKKWMTDSECENVVEMTWWDEDTLPGNDKIKFVCTPAQHWSKRTLTDTCKALWCSWAVIGPSNRFFFAGDTGYCKGFEEIGAKYGPFTLAAIPIGAYNPRYFMKPQHVNPEEAVQIHHDILAKYSLGIHWGTFKLTYEPYLEPRELLQEEVRKRNMEKDSFITLYHGEIKKIGADSYLEID